MTAEGHVDGRGLLDQSYVVDLHIHVPSFVPQPFRAAWRALTPGAPPPVGLGAIGGGVNAVVVTAVGDPVVTRCYRPRSRWRAVDEQLSQIERQAAAAGAVLVRSVAELTSARDRHRLAVLLGVEGADALGSDVDRVDAWYERGVRLVTLVHLGDNLLGSTCLPWQRYLGPLPARRSRAPGLSQLGTRVVARMNRLGVLVDVAHADSDTLLAVVESTAAPIVSSHTGARARQDFPRYLTDDELRAIAGTGGVVGLWPYRRGGTGVRDLADLVAHARHIADVIGPAHLALGTDLNGIPGAMAGFRGPRDLVGVTSALLDAGFEHPEVAGILGGNARRVLTRVEECASARP